MNTSEFKAWFDGFAEAIGKNTVPTAEQWKRIKDEVAKLTAETKYIPTSIREPLAPAMPKPWYPDTNPQWPDWKWKQGEIICRSGESKVGTAYSVSYSDTIDSLTKNGTHKPEDAIKG